LTACNRRDSLNSVIDLKGLPMSATALKMPPEPTWPISVARYHKMIAAGVLTEEDQVELLEGWILPKMPKNPPHVFAVETLIEIFLRLNLTDYFIRGQNPVTTTDSEPEPDVCIVRGSRRDFLKRHPRPKDAALVVEVAESSIARDRGLKKRIYARALAPVYWIVNLEERQIEVYSEPVKSKGEYRLSRIFKAGAAVPLIVDGREVAQIPVSDVVP
jgi:Uma2 family endonuclease